ncbi:MAG: hypothetical protein ACJAST_002899 [Halopseudomonas sp.]|jgi:hypothetical protein
MTDSLELRDIERILELVDLTAFEWHGSHHMRAILRVALG